MPPTYPLRTVTVAVVIVGLLVLAVPVSAHGNADGAPVNGTAEEWTAWMTAHMTEHMGPGAVEWMTSHMGMSMDEMGQYMAGNPRMTPGQHC